jgi:addiction module RelE/StbE family toxin
MLTPVLSAQFKRDVDLLQRRNKDMSKLAFIIRLIAQGIPLQPQYRDHPLKGDRTGSSVLCVHGYYDCIHMAVLKFVSCKAHILSFKYSRSRNP